MNTDKILHYVLIVLIAIGLVMLGWTFTRIWQMKTSRADVPASYTESPESSETELLFPDLLVPEAKPSAEAPTNAKQPSPAPTLGRLIPAPRAMYLLQLIEERVQRAQKEELKGEVDKAELEQTTLNGIDNYIELMDDPSVLYATAIVLYEGYDDEFRESLRERLLFMTREAVVFRLCRLGSEEAYAYFRRLHEHYGTDAGESRKYKEMEEEFPRSIRQPND